MLVLLDLGLEGNTEVDTDPKGRLCSSRLLPLMTMFSVFVLLQGIAPANSWQREGGGVSLKDYKIIWKIIMREMKKKVL